ncbi:hypothetical protein [Paenibacillus cremeus]|uniref:Lipoprotein n=1 Tax=Paenibacillus cremeus TaxID=2163881 RepID=A0A559KB71_9BACL|nr:hypothetical protein [Paenibacillus cremeus]TVY09377.1 hypothetical protein FPZ49_14460 [Paenibacillus cremeus]
MRKIGIALVAMTVLLGGCTQKQDERNTTQMKTMQKTVGKDRLLQTFGQITPPPMGKDIMNQSDAQVIAWIKQVDDWTHQVLSSPVTGEMDAYAMREMRTHLMQVYTTDMAERLIAYFYREDPTTGTYQANSTKAMLGLRSEWGQYELSKSHPGKDQYKITLSGKTKQDYSEPTMHHESSYQIQGDKLIITDFKTTS